MGISKVLVQQDRVKKNVHVFQPNRTPVLRCCHKYKSGNERRRLVNGNAGPVVVLLNILGDMSEGFVEDLRQKYEQFTSKGTE